MLSVRRSERPYVRPHFSKSTKTKQIFIVGLVEWIIDDSCLVLFFSARGCHVLRPNWPIKKLHLFFNLARVPFVKCVLICYERQYFTLIFDWKSHVGSWLVGRRKKIRQITTFVSSRYEEGEKLLCFGKLLREWVLGYEGIFWKEKSPPCHAKWLCWDLQGFSEKNMD